MSRPRFTVGSNQYVQHLRPYVPQYEDPGNDVLGTDSLGSVSPSLVASRRTLCAVLDVLRDHRDAITIIGAHAVHERTGSLPFPSTTTKDADAAISPSLVANSPLIGEALSRIGLSPLHDIADELPEGHPGRRWLHHPGLWASSIDDAGFPVDEIDLLVPDAMAGAGRRSVRELRQHGKNAVGRVSGVELAVLERDLMSLENYVDGSRREAWVSRPSGILCAKSCKISDRLQGSSRTRQATIPKDATDMWRCMIVSDPRSVLSQFEGHLDHPRCGEAVDHGLRKFTSLLRDDLLRSVIAEEVESLGGTRADVDQVFESWREAFAKIGPDSADPDQ